MAKLDLRSLNYEEYVGLIKNLQEAEYRAKQLYQWVFQKGVTEFAQMTNLPGTFRAKLDEKAYVVSLSIEKKIASQVDGTVRYVLGMPDGHTVEAVRMSYLGRESRDRQTVCISSQVGCAMGCVFCATGLAGWVRNLTTGEIIGQVLTAQQDLQSSSPGAKITNVVLMGMGEPLLNYENVVKAIRILNDPAGLNISMRKITLSTSGLVPQIKKLALENMPLVLAISLHAATNDLRDQLVPINKKYPLEELLAACEHYIRHTGRRITFEYALIADVNDKVLHAKALAKLLKGMLANINLIPLNAVAETRLHRPKQVVVQKFVNILREAGLEANIREEKGGDIAAACGQLRGKGEK